MQRTIYFPRQLIDKLEREARRRGYPLRVHIIFILNHYLKNMLHLHHQKGPAQLESQGNTQ